MGRGRAVEDTEGEDIGGRTDLGWVWDGDGYDGVVQWERSQRGFVETELGDS